MGFLYQIFQIAASDHVFTNRPKHLCDFVVFALLLAFVSVDGRLEKIVVRPDNHLPFHRHSLFLAGLAFSLRNTKKIIVQLFHGF